MDRGSRNVLVYICASDDRYWIANLASSFVLFKNENKNLQKLLNFHLVQKVLPWISKMIVSQHVHL